MPVPVNVEQLIKGRVVEQARIEYKAGWNREDILHALCAFANDIDNIGGGYIIVGVDEQNGMPVEPVRGLDPADVDGFQRDLLSLCHKIQPVYMPECEPVEYGGKQLLVIWAPGGAERPYRAKVSCSDQSKDLAYYVRRFSSTVKASQWDVERLLEMRGPTFDDSPNYSATLADLRRSRVEDYLTRIGSSLAGSEVPFAELAKSLHLVSGPPEDLHPVNVALLFFSDDPEQYFREARIEIVEIPDPTGDGMTEHIFRGPLDKQLEDALSYIKNAVISERIFKIDGQAKSERYFNYPYEAIEEALCNAVYHKSYKIPEPIEVRIAPNKITITSCPGPDVSISDADVVNGMMVSRMYRNRRIGDILKELQMAEGRNTGLPKIHRHLYRNGSPEPRFITDIERRYLSVEFGVQPSFKVDEEPFPSRRLWHADDVDETVSAQGALDQSGPEAKSRKRRAKQSAAQLKRDIHNYLLSGEEASQLEISKNLGYARITTTFRNAMNELLDEGSIVRTTQNPRNPRTKYRLS